MQRFGCVKDLARHRSNLEHRHAQAHLAAVSRKPAAPSRTRRKRLKVFSIGFDLGGEAPLKSVEKRAADLRKDASSLLLLQSVMEGKPAQAFLKVLLSLQRKSAEDTLSSYGLFYKEMAATHSASWQDYLLEEVLSGRNNSWAKAVANRDSNSASVAAIQHDLDILMRLALGDRSLASMVKEAHSGISEDWMAAASSIGPASVAKEEDPDLGISAASREELDSRCDVIQGPPTSKERHFWREKIGGQWKWSQALPDLECFFCRHGIGLTQRHSLLEWKNEALQGFMPYQPDSDSPSEELLTRDDERAAQEIKQRIEEHVSGSSSPQAIGLWSSQINIGWQLLVNGPQEAHANRGLRIILIPSATLAASGSMHVLARSLTQHKRIKFLVVAGLLDTDALPHDVGKLSNDLVSSLSATRGMWPQNALPAFFYKLSSGSDTSLQIAAHSSSSTSRNSAPKASSTSDSLKSSPP